MWHEARRQERKIRGMLVDYRRRAERRRDFYEKIKADPTQFLQIHGRQCKIHLDANIAAAADTAVMMPWQGQSDNLIDRFDVRAHLDFIPQVDKVEEEKLTQEERHLNYERYRIIAQNAFLGVPEEKFLKQLHLEEQFGYTEYKSKKDTKSGGAAIGFNYDDSTGVPQEVPAEEPSEDENSDSDLDVDLAINVSKMDPAQANEMNKHGRSYGMSSNDFYSYLINDLEEAEAVKQAREEEQEKALFSGRKSRRERRYHREKRLANRTISPPSYAAKASPTLPNFRESKSHSRTPSPENSGKITYITSFGEDEEAPSSSKTSINKGKHGKSKGNVEKFSSTSIHRRRSRSKSRSKDKYSSKSSRSKNNVKKTRRSRTRSRSRSKRSRSNSRSGYRRRSRSLSSHSRSYTRSRSRSRRKSRSRGHSRPKGYRRRWSYSSSSSSSTRSSSSDSSRRRSPKKITPERNKNELSQVQLMETTTDAIPRYYGRRKDDKSSSELSDLNEDEKTTYDSNNIEAQKDSNAIKKPSTSLTIIERLKRKRQALLNRQFKADKIAEQAKIERERLEQQTREDELREMAIKLRKRQREKRHANDSVSSSDSDDSSRSYESNYSKDKSRSRSREKESRRHKRRRNSNDRRSSSSRERERRRRDRRERERERDRRGRWSSSPNRNTKLNLD